MYHSSSSDYGVRSFLSSCSTKSSKAKVIDYNRYKIINGKIYKFSDQDVEHLTEYPPRTAERLYKNDKQTRGLSEGREYVGVKKIHELGAKRGKSPSVSDSSCLEDAASVVSSSGSSASSIKNKSYCSSSMSVSTYSSLSDCNFLAYEEKRLLNDQEYMHYIDTTSTKILYGILPWLYEKNFPTRDYLSSYLRDDVLLRKLSHTVGASKQKCSVFHRENKRLRYVQFLMKMLIYIACTEKHNMDTVSADVRYNVRNIYTNNDRKLEKISINPLQDLDRRKELYRLCARLEVIKDLERVSRKEESISFEIKMINSTPIRTRETKKPLLKRRRTFCNTVSAIKGGLSDSKCITSKAEGKSILGNEYGRIKENARLSLEYHREMDKLLENIQELFHNAEEVIMCFNNKTCSSKVCYMSACNIYDKLIKIVHLYEDFCKIGKYIDNVVSDDELLKGSGLPLKGSGLPCV